ncbi:MAG: DUF3311 domain-containing protein [Ktedonobacterales bacterium]
MSDDRVGARSTTGGKSNARYWAFLLLLIPFISMLWVSTYNVKTPEVLGFPFFYWYQLLWVVVSAVLTAIVYFIVK